MRWNDNKKHGHPKWEQANAESRIKSNWRKAVASVHNKISRGAEYIGRIIRSGHGEEWRKSHGHNPEQKHHGSHHHPTTHYTKAKKKD